MFQTVYIWLWYGVGTKFLVLNCCVGRCGQVHAHCVRSQSLPCCISVVRFSPEWIHFVELLQRLDRPHRSCVTDMGYKAHSSAGKCAGLEYTRPNNNNVWWDPSRMCVWLSRMNSYLCTKVVRMTTQNTVSLLLLSCTSL